MENIKENKDNKINELLNKKHKENINTLDKIFNEIKENFDNEFKAMVDKSNEELEKIIKEFSPKIKSTEEIKNTIKDSIISSGLSESYRSDQNQFSKDLGASRISNNGDQNSIHSSTIKKLVDEIPDVDNLIDLKVSVLKKEYECTFKDKEIVIDIDPAEVREIGADINLIINNIGDKALPEKALLYITNIEQKKIIKQEIDLSNIQPNEIKEIKCNIRFDCPEKDEEEHYEYNAVLLDIENHTSISKGNLTIKTNFSKKFSQFTDTKSQMNKKILKQLSNILINNNINNEELSEKTQEKILINSNKEKNKYREFSISYMDQPDSSNSKSLNKSSENQNKEISVNMITKN